MMKAFCNYVCITILSTKNNPNAALGKISKVFYIFN